MKTNLKTHPCRNCDMLINKVCVRPCPAPIEWVWDFEAKLRKEVNTIESYKGTNLRIFYHERYLVLKKLKEILGESK